MTTIEHFSDLELPDHFLWQILSFMRIEWPDGFSGVNQYRDWIDGHDEIRQHFVIVHNNLLISYVGVVSRTLEFKGEQYITYGLSGMFTYPSFRKQGHGLKLAKAASEYIYATDADIILFTSCLHNYYERIGYTKFPDLKLIAGDKELSQDEPAFLAFISDKAKKSRSSFENGSLNVGDSMW